MTSQSKTDTDGRLKKLLKTRVGDQILDSTDKKITQAIDDASIKSGIVTKFYPYLDQAEIKLKNNKKIVAKMSHNFMGSIRDYYTPDGYKSYCKTLNEPCIIPRDTLNCFVAPVDDDEVKWIFLAYFNKDAIVGFTPPGSGCMKIFNFRATNEDYLEFCGDGLKLMARKPVKLECGEYSDDISEIHYAEVENVYSKEEVDGFVEDLDDRKVDKVPGKELSSNDFTDEEKAKLDSLDPYGDIIIDSSLSLESTNPVENRVITTEINKKVNTTDLASVATSGSYNDLTNKPDIPSSVNDLNDGNNVIMKSNTSGLIKNDGSIDTNNYLTSHAPVDSSLNINSTNAIQNQAVTIALNGKANVFDWVTEIDNVVVSLINYGESL